ncbi:hypothetical protein J6590_096859 [Homalodisca vitripennis]|nr:hypothetical protein J6590_096859 [Homalodisca vitripennis]
MKASCTNTFEKENDPQFPYPGVIHYEVLFKHTRRNPDATHSRAPRSLTRFFHDTTEGEGSLAEVRSWKRHSSRRYGFRRNAERKWR